MDTFEKILNIIKENKGIISTAEIVKLGIDKKYLSLMTQKKMIERTSRGCKRQVKMHLARKTILHLLERKKWLNPPLLFEF